MFFSFHFHSQVESFSYSFLKLYHRFIVLDTKTVVRKEGEGKEKEGPWTHKRV